MNEKHVVSNKETGEVLAIVRDERAALEISKLFSAMIEVEVQPISYYDFCFEPIRKFLGDY